MSDIFEMFLIVYMIGVICFMLATIQRENKMENRIKKLEDK